MRTKCHSRDVQPPAPDEERPIVHFFAARHRLPRHAVVAVLTGTTLLAGCGAANDQACLDELRAGTVAAIVTQAMTAGDVDTIAGASVLGTGPVLVERRPMLVNGRGGDAGALRAAIDQAIADARLDGTLSEMAVRRFGGEDVSAVP